MPRHAAAGTTILSTLPDPSLIARIPKVELHLHLEGAIPPATLLRIINRKERMSAEELAARLAYTDFADFIATWSWKNGFIDRAADFEEIAFAVLADLHGHNVLHVEAFYSPGDFARHGLATEAITESLLQGCRRAHDAFGIRCDLIVDLVRDHGPEVGRRRLDEVTPYLGEGLIGIGLGGSEQYFPADPYASVFREAAARGFRLTAHAGEVAGAASVRAAVELLGAERIGHGLRAFEDPGLVRLLAERRIPLEICPVSNLRTGAWPDLASHPIRGYREAGVPVALCTDDPAMFGTSPSHEYAVLLEHLGFDLADLEAVSLGGVDASFLPEPEKARLRNRFASAWAALRDEFSLTSLN